MANIVLKTFAAGDEGQGTVTPQDDALIYQNAVSVNGIFGGATVTLTGANTLHVASGFGIICGRFFEINESDISVQLSSSGTLSGRLKIHLDLNNADNPIEIVTETGSTLPSLSGDSNININGGAFDMELCTFSVNELTISSLVNTFPTIDNTSKQVRRKTAYAVDDFALCQSASDSLIFVCTTAGTTAIQEPTAYQTVTDGNTVTDGTAVFKAVSVSGQITKLSKTEVLISNSGDVYDSTKAYAVGDYCIYNDVLYRCTTACSAGSWATNQSCFTQDTLVNAVDKLSNNISGSSDEYNSTSAYSVGDYVIHDDKLYRCITACSAGSWATNQSCFTADTLVNVANKSVKVMSKSISIGSNGNGSLGLSASTYLVLAVFNTNRSDRVYLPYISSLNGYIWGVSVYNDANPAQKPTNETSDLMIVYSER